MNPSSLLQKPLACALVALSLAGAGCGDPGQPRVLIPGTSVGCNLTLEKNSLCAADERCALVDSAGVGGLCVKEDVCQRAICAKGWHCTYDQTRTPPVVECDRDR